MFLILVILLVLILAGGGYGYRTGVVGYNAVGLVLLILIVLLLFSALGGLVVPRYRVW
jgi:hypothetical protein